MRAYLDYNIFTSIENNEFEIDKILKNVNKNITEFPFSSAHIQEMESISAPTEEERNKFINRKIETIKQVTNCLYIFQEYPSNKVYPLKEDPLNVLETIREFPYANASIKIFINLISNDQKNEFFKALGINKIELNNYSPSQVVQHLNAKLTCWGMQVNFIQLIEKALSFYPDQKGFGQHNITYYSCNDRVDRYAWVLAG
jgi:hypothetical protein